MITGGYGFIGSHVADRFHKEGYEVYIIDNLSTGNASRITFKHKGYKLSVQDGKCEEIFRMGKFDVVVHLAAQTSSEVARANPVRDAETNLLGLINMLNLSVKYNVPKFIYASSADVYGEKTNVPIREEETCAPASPYALAKWIGEIYCGKWREMYGLQTIVFRISNAYGPRQSERSGVVSAFLNGALSGKPLHVYGDGSETRDFIYVEDIADAIYRASLSPIAGTYNLSTGMGTSVNELIDAFKELRDMGEVVYNDRRPGDIGQSVLDNASVKRDLDWSPIYGIREGLKRTYEYAVRQQQAETQQAQAAAEVQSAAAPAVRSVFRRLLPYAENLLAFLLTAWLTLGQQYSSYGTIDVKLFYITIMGIMYGNRQSILAVLLSTGLFVYHKTLGGRELVALMYDPDFFFRVAIYLFIGLVVGYTIERKNAQIQQQQQQLQEVEGKYEFLSGIYEEVREVKDELQQRILNMGDSYGKIYSVTKELESLEPEQVFHAAVNVVRSVTQASEVSIYVVNRNRAYLRLVAHAGTNQAVRSLKVEEREDMAMVLQDGKLYVNKQLSPDRPLMCAPLYYRDQIGAVVAIDGLPFDKFSLYHQNLFKITCDLVSSALTKAFAYMEATENQRYVEGTSLLRPEAFREIMRAKKQAMEQHRTPFLLLRGEIPGDLLFETANQIEGMLRETDYTGLDEKQRLLVLLSNTNPEDASRVIERFAERGIILGEVKEAV